MERRRWFSGLALAAVLALVAGPPAARAAQHHVLRMSDGLDVGTLNPLLATSGNITWLSGLTMAHFVRFDENDKLVPELITEIPSPQNGGVSRDGRAVTYHLRRGVKWSDGAPFDSGDVVFTVRAILDPTNNVSQRDAWDRVTGATAPDKYTVILHLRTPYAPFASRYFSSNNPSCVLPQHILGPQTNFNEAPYNALPVGIGPFRYTAFRRGDAVEMEANPNYFRGPPKLQKIVYKIITEDNTLFTQLQTGELDLWSAMSGNFVDRVTHVPGVRVLTAPSQYMAAVYLNTTRPVLRDRQVRRALRLATNREMLLRNIYHSVGTLAQSVVPRISVDFDPTLPPTPYDPAAAERILDAAGWRRGADGMRAKDGLALVVNIAIPTGYLPSSSTAEILRADWGKLGIGVEVKGYQSEQFFGPAGTGGIVSTGRFDAALLSIPGTYLADVSADYGCKYAPPNGFNESRYCNPAVDAAMDAYVTSYDPRRRAKLARTFQRLIDGDAPAIVTYERSFAYGFNAALTGFHPNSFAPFDNFLDVDI